MARYLKHQDEIKIYVNEYGDLTLVQTWDHGEESHIIVNSTNVDWFCDLIKMAFKDGQEEESE